MKEYKLVYPHGKKPFENKEIITSESNKLAGATYMSGETLSYALIDLETREKIAAKIVLSSRQEDLPEGAKVWLQDEKEYEVEAIPWFVKIIEYIEEEEEEVEVLPKMKISLGKQRGGMLKTLMEKEKN